MEKVEEACKRWKNNKALGPGGIPAEVVKYTCIQGLVKDCLDGAEVSQEWKVAWISVFHKNGSKYFQSFIQKNYKDKN